jgi:acetylornithine deacetylase/succinyl-diaminopimelate desuccinylase-like protein
MRAKIHGPAGHGSLIHQGGAMAKLAKILKALDENLLPVHIVPGVRQMFHAMADGLSFPSSFVIRQMLNPSLTDPVLKILGENGNLFKPLLSNTVNATIVQGGNKVNVIPGEITLEMDGRLLPGFTPEDMLREIHELLKMDIEIEVMMHDPGPSDPDMGLFHTLGGILKSIDPEAIPLPLVLSAVTDGRFFSRLGIQTYGFTPMQLPPDMNFSQTIHAANERIPVAAVEFGTEAIFQAMQQFHA